ncbi:MAG: glycogen/starch/alpha-glucan phosphorylase [Candidatus Izemoplasmatales bacterium]
MKQPHFQSPAVFAATFVERLRATYLTDVASSSVRQRFNILGTLVREAIADDWIATSRRLEERGAKEVYYFSMEFLMGRLITNNLINMGVRDVAEQAFDGLGLDLNELEEFESDPGLGNGGLGRLAACYLDSMASLGIPGFGHCIRYRYGLFRQAIKNGYQEERPDNWLSDGYVWEVRKEEESEDVAFGGNVEWVDGKFVYRPGMYVRAVPYDVPIVGADNGVVNHLRLWNAEASRKYPKGRSAFEYEFELQKLSGFLYPDDTTEDGKRLRLMQQYFFTSAGVKGVVRRHKARFGTVRNLAEKAVFHINDTHPTLIIPELMRILVDEEGMEWEDAWRIVTASTAYTNHTIMSEALEKWPTYLLQPVLPRIFQLIEEINRRFTNDLLERYTYDQIEKVNRMAIIAGGQVRMANLCLVACRSVNGVAKLHTDILKNIEMNDFYRLMPEKFKNVTNGITHRRWLIHSNPELTAILDGAIGVGWRKDPAKLSDFERFADDGAVQASIAEMKRAKKAALAARIRSEHGVEVDPDSLFDIQVKRLHEYKRQLLNALHIMAVYEKLKTDPAFKAGYVPHTFVFGAKAAGAYFFAKKVIKLINTIGDKVNADPDTNALLKVVFVENYNVSYAEKIMPAADLSEQISTASKEASGTGNMKFMMNGALTIGTEDGANVEIHELVGDDHIFVFGLRSEDVTRIARERNYRPMDHYESDPELRLTLDRLVNGFFQNVAPDEFREIRDRLLYDDTYLILKDFRAYCDAHERANEAYKDPRRWFRSAIVNIARSGVFSSDRSIREYAEGIWHVEPSCLP